METRRREQLDVKLSRLIGGVGERSRRAIDFRSASAIGLPASRESFGKKLAGEI